MKHVGHDSLRARIQTWLDHDGAALAFLILGIAVVELLAMAAVELLAMII